MHVEVIVSAGARKYVGGTVSDQTGADISGLTYQVSFGSATQPGRTWFTPDISVSPGGAPTKRTLKYLLTSTTPANLPYGTYYVWIKITATPELEPIRVPTEYVVR